MPQVLVPVGCETGTVQLRSLVPADIPRIRELCRQWFPIQYPEHWYEDITSSPRFFSLAAVIDGQLQGLIVSETKTRSRCNREDQDIVAAGFREDPLVAYILSLGVVVNKRRQGIGRQLLQQLFSHLNKSAQSGFVCRAVFLHVLSTNADAIRFYESQRFCKHQFLPLYYFINGDCRDGISYVRYLNGGRPPLTCASVVKLIVSLSSAVPITLYRLIRNMLTYCIRRLSRFAQIPSRFTNAMPHSYEGSNSGVKYRHVASA